MTAIIVLGLLVLAIAAICAWRMDQSEKRASKERQLLLERIQKPERLFVTEQPTQMIDPLPNDADELAKLNAIFPED